ASPAARSGGSAPSRAARRSPASATGRPSTRRARTAMRRDACRGTARRPGRSLLAVGADRRGAALRDRAWKGSSVRLRRRTHEDLVCEGALLVAARDRPPVAGWCVSRPLCHCRRGARSSSILGRSPRVSFQRARFRRALGQDSLAPVAQECLDHLRAERAGEQEALAAVAVLLPDQRELLRALDALGQGLDRERLAELNEASQEDLTLVPVADLRDERAVDLERVDWELLEVGERRVAGAEVVDRDPHAEPLDLQEPACGLLGIAHER